MEWGGAKRTEVRGVGNRFPWGVSSWGFAPFFVALLFGVLWFDLRSYFYWMRPFTPVGGVHSQSGLFCYQLGPFFPSWAVSLFSWLGFFHRLPVRYLIFVSPVRSFFPPVTPSEVVFFTPGWSFATPGLVFFIPSLVCFTPGLVFFSPVRSLSAVPCGTNTTPTNANRTTRRSTRTKVCVF